MPENSHKASANVDEIARIVLEQINNGEVSQTVTPRTLPSGPTSRVTINRPPSATSITQSQCLYTDLDEATQAARAAQRKFLDCSMEIRKQIITNIGRLIPFTISHPAMKMTIPAGREARA